MRELKVCEGIGAVGGWVGRDHLSVPSNCFEGILPIKLVRAPLKPKLAGGFRFPQPTLVSIAFSRQSVIHETLENL